MQDMCLYNQETNGNINIKTCFLRWSFFPKFFFPFISSSFVVCPSFISCKTLLKKEILLQRVQKDIKTIEMIQVGQNIYHSQIRLIQQEKANTI